MMNIIWTNKPVHHDTRSVTQVWFNKSSVRYTTVHDNHVFTAKLRDINVIVDDDAYREHRAAAYAAQAQQ